MGSHTAIFGCGSSIPALMATACVMEEQTSDDAVDTTSTAANVNDEPRLSYSDTTALQDRATTPPQETNTTPRRRRRANQRDNRRQILRRAFYWTTFCSGTFTFFGIMSLCMALIAIKLPIEPVVKARPSVSVLADGMFVLLALNSLSCCTFALLLAKSIMLI